MGPILILGKDGQVGRELGGTLAPLGPVVAWGRRQADLDRPETLAPLIRELKPRAIVNAAAYTAVDQAETDRDTARRVNAESPAVLAGLASQAGAWLVHYSTDYVYDGRKEAPYAEEDAPNPLSVYGRTKLAGDEAVAGRGGRYLIFRTSWVFSRHGRNFPQTILRLAAEKESLTVVDDQWGAPTSAEFLAAATALALQKALASGPEASGLYHLTASGETTWRRFAVFLVDKARELGWPLKIGEVSPRPTDPAERPARRPLNSRLSLDKFRKTFHLTPPPWTYYADRLLSDLDVLHK